MKKIILIGIILGSVIMASSVFAQTITQELNAMNTNMKQATDLMNGRDLLENTYRVCKAHNDYIQQLVDSGQFNSIPLNVRQALNRAWTELKAYIAAVEADTEIMEAFDWQRE